MERDGAGRATGVGVGVHVLRGHAGREGVRGATAVSLTAGDAARRR